MNIQNTKKLYQAFLDKNPDYEGTFYVGIKTTGIFCRSTCSTKKAKFENCNFFITTEEALLVGYRPCKICNPISVSNSKYSLIYKLIHTIESNPEKRWKENDFRKLGIDTSTIRRQFKKRFGVTFVAYARALRMGLAYNQIRSGQSIINTQIDSGYDSSSGFTDAFTKIMGDIPTEFKNNKQALKSSLIDTKLGAMITISNENSLVLLEFVNRKGLKLEIERLKKKSVLAIIPGMTNPIKSIKKELDAYFKGKLKTFNTPFSLCGTTLQNKVWNNLIQIPYGTTQSYSELSEIAKSPRAIRAVATAIGTNQLAIIIPCHRVISKNGMLGGYSGGLIRKKWLLEFEKNIALQSQRTIEQSD